MKKLIIATILGIALTNNSFSETFNDLTEISQLNTEYLYKTWYAKQILINGNEDKENFPVNNDELMLNRDMTVISIDKTYNEIDKGTWTLHKDSFTVIGQEQSFTFKIIMLTENELVTKMINDEFEMIIKYRSTK